MGSFFMFLQLLMRRLTCFQISFINFNGFFFFFLSFSTEEVNIMTGDAIGGSGMLYFIFSSIYSGIFFRITLEMYISNTS